MSKAAQPKPVSSRGTSSTSSNAAKKPANAGYVNTTSSNPADNDGNVKPRPTNGSKNFFLTQDDDPGKPDIYGIVRFSTYSSDRIKRLTAANFTLDDKLIIGLKYDDCIIVLFHAENKESHAMMKIWYLVAEQTPGPIYASCNVLQEYKVGEAFARVKMDGSHPLNPYALHQWPVIIVYRKGMPVAVYNGESDVQTIIDWSLILACRANYYEPVQEFASMQAEFRHDMPSPLIYPDEKLNPEARVSSQFMSTQSKRGFYKSGHVVRSGSKEDEREAIEQHELMLRRAGVKPTKAELLKNVVRNPETETSEEIDADIDEQMKEEEEANQPPPGQNRPRNPKASSVGQPISAPAVQEAKVVNPSEGEEEEGVSSEEEEEGVSEPVEGVEEE
jgi:hypothetical protein